jgi:hypothetical protein
MQLLRSRSSLPAGVVCVGAAGGFLTETHFTRLRSWLGQYTASQKVAGSNPDNHTRFSNRPILSSTNYDTGAD